MSNNNTSLSLIMKSPIDITTDYINYNNNKQKFLAPFIKKRIDRSINNRNADIDSDLKYIRQISESYDFIHGTQISICPTIETPEGEKVGLCKNYSSYFPK